MDDRSSTTTTTMEITSQTIFSRAESSMALVTQHIKTLPIQDIIKILTPVKARLLSEDTILHINTLNFSVDHVVMPLTVKEVLEILGPQWQR
uniref:Uncharacterized protein n=1 Tax=Panagrolaimus sp. PS1159 TaxID=55785 RepID=A0AC35G5V6_9BILA